MKRRRQKNFAWTAAIAPIINGVGAAAGVAGVAQGAGQMMQANDQMKKQEELAEQQRKSDKKITNALNKIAESGNPQAQQAGQLVAQQKGFAALPFSIMRGLSKARTAGRGFLNNHETAKNAWGLAKDFYGTQKENIKTAAVGAAGFGAINYIGNRVATSIKDHDEGNDDKNKNFLLKAAGTAAAVGGGILAAKHGMMGKSAQTFMTSGKGGQLLSKVGKATNPIEKNAEGKIDWKGSALKNMFNVGFAAAPSIMYLRNKGQKDEMVNNQMNNGQQQEEQQQFSESIMSKFFSDEEGNKSGLKKAAIGVGALAATALAARAGYKGNFGKTVQGFMGKGAMRTGNIMKQSFGMNKLGSKVINSGHNALSQAADTKVANTFKSGLSDTPISGAINKASTILGFYGKGGTNAVQNTANTLAESNNKWSKNVGEYFQKHKTQANLLAGAGALGAGAAIMEAGEKPFKMVDSHAYDIDKE